MRKNRRCALRRCRQRRGSRLRQGEFSVPPEGALKADIVRLLNRQIAMIFSQATSTASLQVTWIFKSSFSGLILGFPVPNRVPFRSLTIASHNNRLATKLRRGGSGMG